jgi:PAS domain S-box-containing protein
MSGDADGSVPLRYVIETYLARTSDAVVITDGELRPDTPGPIIQYANMTAARISGHNIKDLIGSPVSMLYTPEVFPRILEQLRETAESRQPWQHDTQTISRDGREVWLQVNTVPIAGANGQLSHFVRIGRDISVHKRMEQEREATQRLLASVFGVIDQALGVVDEAGNFSMVNTAVTRQLGWSVFDLIGKPFTTVIEEASRKWLTRQLAAREELEQTCRLPTQLVHRDGTVAAGEIVSTIIMQPDGREFRVITFKETPTAAIPADLPLSTTVQRLLDCQGSPAALVAGKLQLVGLAEVRAALGDRWCDVQANVFTLAERILRRHLGPGDVYHRTTDDGFLVCFAEFGEAAAQAKASAIADEIRATFTGVAPEMASAGVESYAAKVEIERSESGSDESIIQALEGRLERERGRLEGGALDALSSGLANAHVVFLRARTDTNQVAPFSVARLPKPLETSLDTLRALGRMEYGLEAELLLMTGAAERLLSQLTANRSDVIVVPVRMSTLVQRRDAERWLQIVRSMVEAGKRRLLIEIIGLARDTARTRMADMVMTLTTLCRTVAFELPTADPGFIAGLPTAVALTTIPLQRLGNEDGTGHVAAAGRLLKTLNNRNARLLVKDIPTPGQAMSLAKAGVPLLLTQQDSSPAG